MISFGMGPVRGEDGVLSIALPLADAKLPSIAADDIGACALGIFRQRQRWIGRSVGVAGDHLSAAELASGLEDALRARSCRPTRAGWSAMSSAFRSADA
jgi:hypothetical protein